LNSTELRFLYHHCHHHRHHHHGGDLSADNSASSDNQQQQQQTPSTSAVLGDAAVTNDNNGSRTCPTATTTTTDGDVISSNSNNNTAIPSCNKPMYFALKVINLVMVQEDKIAQLKNEVEILKTLDHPNIIKVYETFNTKRQVMMIMELCTGGDLYARMPYTEKQVADMLRPILLAIRYIHARHIVHRGE
jgi:serine/threonine protein kinase